METLEKTLHSNRDWALDRIHTLCESDNHEDVVNAYAIALEYMEWFAPTTEFTDILSLQFRKLSDD